MGIGFFFTFFLTIIHHPFCFQVQTNYTVPNSEISVRMSTLGRYKVKVAYSIPDEICTVNRFVFSFSFKKKHYDVSRQH
jgi:hypothetical protein